MKKKITFPTRVADLLILLGIYWGFTIVCRYSSKLFVFHGNIFTMVFRLLYIMIIPLSVCLLLIYIINRIKKAAPFNLDIKPVKKEKNLLRLISIALTVFIIGIQYPVGYLFQFPSANMSTAHFIIFSIFAITLGPLCEEIFYRGILLKGLLASQKPLVAILISSLLFAVIHVELIPTLYSFIFGLFAGWIYYKTKNLSLLIIIHSLYNLIVSLFAVGNRYLWYDTKLPAWGCIIIISLSMVLITTTVLNLNESFRRRRVH